MMNSAVTEFEWAERLADRVPAGMQSMAGYYNDNYRVEDAGVPYLLRVPKRDPDEMDLRRISENPILRYLEHSELDVPRLLHVGRSCRFSVHGWVEGETLNERYPDQDRMPDWLPCEIARQMAILHRLDPAPFADTCASLARSPDTRGFFLAHHGFDRSVHTRLLPEMSDVYRNLGIPDDPFAGLDVLADEIRPRPFCICHSDIHRKNILIRPEREELTLLDWELVLVGDPVYDIAVHFHKIRYAPEQEGLFVDAYLEHSAMPVGAGSLRAQIGLYLQLERVKSAIIDAFRVRGDLSDGNMSDEAALREAARYGRKLDKARAVWRRDGMDGPADAREVRAVLTG